MRLKILYIGTFSARSDEGLSQISKKYYSHFNQKYEVKYFNTFDVIKPSSIKKILKFRPDIIHYLTGPTIRSFIISWLLKQLLPGNVKTILSATRPFFNQTYAKILKFFKPDLILTQAFKWEALFLQHGIRTAFIPNPVDLTKFKKLKTSKAKLREKYGLPLGKKLLLHVGHIKENRKLDFLVQIRDIIQHKLYQVVVVGSTFYQKQNKLTAWLMTNDCIVIDEYLKKIEEIYNACDYYVFPLANLSKNHYPKSYNEIGSIDMPLSILEAVACGLPVISTEIDALEVLFRNVAKPPFAFLAGNNSSFIDALMYLDEGEQFDCSTVIQKIDQNAVFQQIDKHYHNVVGIA
ncbi:hypothetical protein C6A36_00190 [Desulfobacteraceae bacterium SEEP-SAG10]|nr:hypothetical protein C6A36_00190 [Desulfobacteraceae bacterium SEEP-SAG10]